MEFALSSEQMMLQESLKGFLAAQWPLDAVKAYAGGDAARYGALAAGLSEFGLAGLMVAEADGGLGLGALDAVLVQEQLGYVTAPSDFMGQAVYAVAAPALAADVAAGHTRAALALTARASGGAALALSGPSDTHFLSGHADAMRLGKLHANEPIETIDRTRMFTRSAGVGSGEAIPAAAAARALATAQLLVAADTLGAAQAMLDRAVAYAMERKQFGRVIGSYQAVKHLCAEMAAKLEPARAFVWHAAYALDTGDRDALIMAHLAKAHLCDTGTFVARTATEVHGGMGFTDLLGLHYWFKRIGVNRQLFGSPADAREAAARLQGLVASA